MRIEPESSEVGIVLIGSLNPSIFTPDWFARNGILSAKEADASEIEVVHPQIAAFHTDWMNLRVEQERFQAITAEAPYTRLSDLVIKTFKEILSHTPLAMLGINRDVHFDVRSSEVRDRIGDKLVPKDPWGDWAPNLSAGEGVEHGGMTSLRMVQRKVDDRPQGGHIQATVEPSRRKGLGDTGIFVQVNDHYVAEHPEAIKGSEEMIAILENRFEESLKRSEWIIDQIMKLK